MSNVNYEWDPAVDTALLQEFATKYDSDDIRAKEKVKQALLDNRFIIHVLDNDELEETEATPDEYFNVNILPYYLIADTQSNVKNFICYEVDFDEVARYNKVIKVMTLTFYILCEHKTIIEKDTGLARHDLLGALILDEFNWTNMFGSQIHCVSDKSSVTDSDYSTRTIVLQGEFTNSIVRTENNKTKVINQDIRQTGRYSENG